MAGKKTRLELILENINKQMDEHPHRSPIVSRDDYPIIQEYIIKLARDRYGPTAYTQHQNVTWRTQEVISK